MLPSRCFLKTKSYFGFEERGLGSSCSLSSISLPYSRALVKRSTRDGLRLRIWFCSLFSSGLGGQVGPVCRLEVLAPTRDLKSNKEDETKTMKCSILGRMWWFISIISFVFHFPFQCGFPPGFPVSTLHTCVTNINNYNNKDTKPNINSNDQWSIWESLKFKCGFPRDGCATATYIYKQQSSTKKQKQTNQAYIFLIR